MTETASSIQYVLMREFLLEARRSAGITQKQLAAAIHRPQSFVHKYETGQVKIDAAEFTLLCETLGIDPATALTVVLQP